MGYIVNNYVNPDRYHIVLCNCFRKSSSRIQTQHRHRGEQIPIDIVQSIGKQEHYTNVSNSFLMIYLYFLHCDINSCRTCLRFHYIVDLVWMLLLHCSDITPEMCIVYIGRFVIRYDYISSGVQRYILEP